MRLTAQGRRERRLEVVKDLVFKGLNGSQIQDALRRRGYDVSLRMVKSDMAMVIARGKERMAIDVAERISHELNILEHVRGLAIDGYYRSTQDAVTTEVTTEQLPADVNADPNSTAGMIQQLLSRAAQGASNIGKQTTKQKRVGQAGDPRHLETVIHTSEQIRKLLGLDPAEVKKLDVSVNGTISTDDLEAMDPTKLSRLINEALHGSPEA